MAVVELVLALNSTLNAPTTAPSGDFSLYTLPQDPPPVAVLTHNEQGRPRIVYKGDVILEADSILWRASPLGYSLTGNVVATKGESEIRAESAELNQEAQRATFRTGVRIVDPVGTLTANVVTIDFSGDQGDPSVWRLDSAEALQIVAKAHEANVVAESISKTGDRIRIRNASAWLGEQKIPDFRVDFRDVVARPGLYVASNSASLRLGKGLRIPLPYFRQPLKRTDTGSIFPQFSVNGDLDPRFSFRNLFEIGDVAGVAVSYSTRLDRVAVSSISFAYSFLGADEDGVPIIQFYNPDGERFMNGYLDNVKVGSVQEENYLVGSRRAMGFVGSSFNVGSTARLGDPIRLDRDWFVGGEFGGALGDFNLGTQIRFGSIGNRRNRDMIERIEVFPSATTPQLRLTRGFTARLRSDGGLYFGDTDYGWIRGVAELGWSPHPFVSVAAGYLFSAEWGDPAFEADRLFSGRAVHLRTDLRLPATKFALLIKHDLDRNRTYDVEFIVKQVIRSVEPFFSYRSFPGTIAFGVSIRADKLLEALKKRAGT